MLKRGKFDFYPKFHDFFGVKKMSQQIFFFQFYISDWCERASVDFFVVRLLKEKRKEELSVFSVYGAFSSWTIVKRLKTSHWWKNKPKNTWDYCVTARTSVCLCFQFFKSCLVFFNFYFLTHICKNSERDIKLFFL